MKAATGPLLWLLLAAADTPTRFSPVIDLKFSCRAPDVIEARDHASAMIGCPAAIRVDQGSESVSRELDLWACAKGVTLDVSRSGKATPPPHVQRAVTGREPERALVPQLAAAEEKLEA